MKGEKKWDLAHILIKNVSYQTSSIPITEVTQKKSRIIAAEAVTLSKTNNETTNEAINGTTDETLKKQKNNSSDYSPFQINIPYFNIKNNFDRDIRCC